MNLAKMSRLPILKSTVVFLVLSFILVLYYPIVFHGFSINDDWKFFVTNPHYKLGLSQQSLPFIFSNYQSDWMPVGRTLRLMIYEVWGMNASAFHASTIVFHMLATVTLLWALCRLRFDFWIAALASALFACHPIHVEAVAWRATSHTVLSAMFMFAAIGAYASYVNKQERRYYILSIVLAAMAMSSKPSAITLPVLLVLIDVYPLQRWRKATDVKKLLLDKVPVFILTLIVACILLSARSQSVADYSLPVRLHNVVLAYASFIRRIVWPTEFYIFYPHPAIDNRPFSVSEVATAYTTLIALTVIVVWLFARRQQPGPAMALAWFLVVLSPVIGIFQSWGEFAGDRYAYGATASIFLFVACCLSWLIGQTSRARPVIAALLIVAVGYLGTSTLRHVKYWNDDYVLFARAGGAYRDEPYYFRQLGMYLWQVELLKDNVTVRRDIPDDRLVQYWNEVVHPTAAKHRQELLEEFERGVELFPREQILKLALGMTQYNVGRSSEAIRAFENAIQADQSNHYARYKLAVAFADDQRFEESRKQLEICELNDKYNVVYLDALATIYRNLDRQEDSLEFEKRAKMLFERANSTLR